MSRKLAAHYWRLAVLLVSIFLIPAAGGAQQPQGNTQIDKIFASLADVKSPGVAVLVRKKGKTVFERGYGVRDLRTMTKIDAQTNFRLASFTKQFTAMAVMLLVHDGKLRYDEKMTEIFPSFPAYGKTITIRNLLNHASGLADYESLMEEQEKKMAEWWTEEKQITDAEVLFLLTQQKGTNFPPGTSWAYSNSGYVVLGLVVAKISGESFGTFLNEQIFAPLKMNGTVAYVKGKNVISHRAYGYTKEALSWNAADQSPTSATLGDGGIYSSLEDLAKWDDALRNHTLLSEAEMQPALTPVKLPNGSEPHWPAEPGGDNLHPGQPVSYGFGWFLDPYQGHARMYHHGETSGFRATIQRFVDQNLTIIVLCNRTDLDPHDLALKVADLYLSSRN